MSDARITVKSDSCAPPLEGILERESKLLERINEAHGKAETSILEAQGKVASILQQGEQEALRQAQNVTEQIEAETKNNLEKQTERRIHECAVLRIKLEANVPSAVACVMGKVAGENVVRCDKEEVI